MSNMNFLSKLTILLSRLLWHFRMANTPQFTFILVDLGTSDSVKSVKCELSSSAGKCITMEVVPFSDGWRRTSLRMIQMRPALLDSYCRSVNRTTTKVHI
jgi:hypothetical protein